MKIDKDIENINTVGPVANTEKTWGCKEKGSFSYNTSYVEPSVN